MMIENNATASIRLGDLAPDFEAVTTHGPIQFSSWQDGRWTILFSHPADFTPVCTTEFVEFSRIQETLEGKGVALLGCSVDSLHSHIAWVRDIEERFSVEIGFPVIADLDQSVSRLYGMIHQPTMTTAPARTVFFIDGASTVRAMITYPPEIGRSFDEIVRVIDALQTSDEHGVACPANWCPGDEVIETPPETMDEAQSRMEDPKLNTPTWYVARRKIQ